MVKVVQKTQFVLGSKSLLCSLKLIFKTFNIQLSDCFDPYFYTSKSCKQLVSIILGVWQEHVVGSSRQVLMICCGPECPK